MNQNNCLPTLFLPSPAAINFEGVSLLCSFITCAEAALANGSYFYLRKFSMCVTNFAKSQYLVRVRVGGGYGPQKLIVVNIVQTTTAGIKGHCPLVSSWFGQFGPTLRSRVAPLLNLRLHRLPHKNIRAVSLRRRRRLGTRRHFRKKELREVRNRTTEPCTGLAVTS